MGCKVSSNVQLVAKRTTVESLRVRPGSFVRQKNARCRDYYDIECELGYGTFASVVKGRHKQTGIARAIKILPKVNIPDEIDQTKFISEISIMREMDHPNIVRIFEFFEDDRNFYLVMELCEGGELLEVVIKTGGVREKRAAKYMKQTIAAVAYWHSKQIVHRDLKPENILLVQNKKDSNIKIADFGTSVLYNPKKKRRSKRQGTLHYLSPEIVKKGQYNEKTDVWSWGVILYILLCGNMPFAGKNEPEVLEKIQKGTFSMKGKAFKHISTNATDLISKMMNPDVSQRLTAEQAYQHPWFSQEITKAQNQDQLFQNTMTNIRTFRADNKLQQAILQFIATQLISQEEHAELQQVFQEFDLQGIGKISTEALIKGAERIIGHNMSSQEIEEILRQVDSDESGFIDYTEFIVAAMDHSKLLRNDRLESAFKVFDQDGSGAISSAELIEMLGEDQVEDNVWSELIQTVDQNGDGEIDLKEFKDLMLNAFRQIIQTILSSKMEQDLTCCVCLDLFKDAVILDCSHNFCQEWVTPIARQYKRVRHVLCPLCKSTTKIRTPGYRRNKIIDSLVEIHKKQQLKKEKRKEKETTTVEQKNPKQTDQVQYPDTVQEAPVANQMHYANPQYTEYQDAPVSYWQPEPQYGYGQMQWQRPYENCYYQQPQSQLCAYCQTGYVPAGSSQACDNCIYF